MQNMLNFGAVEYALETNGVVASIPLLLISVIASLIWLRTGSTHVFMSRLWRIFCGKAACPEASIREILDAETAVCQFQVHTNIKARTVAHVLRIRHWGRVHDVPLQWIGAAKDYFDLDSLGLSTTKRVPDRWQVRLAKLFFPLALALALGTGVLAFYDKGLFVFKTNGKWFSLTDHRVKPLSAGQGFPLAACKANEEISEEDSGFSRAEITALCRHLTPQNSRATAMVAILIQRIYFGFMCGMATFICYDLWRFQRRATAAMAIRDRLNRYSLEQTCARTASAARSEIAVEPSAVEPETEAS